MTLPTAVDRHPRITSASWWFRSPEGRVAVWQFPNPALWVWAGAIAIGLFDLSREHSIAVEGARRGALLAWALDELVRGASPFRRALGAIVFVGQITSMVLG